MTLVSTADGINYNFLLPGEISTSNNRNTGNVTFIEPYRVDEEGRSVSILATNSPIQSFNNRSSINLLLPGNPTSYSVLNGDGEVAYDGTTAIADNKSFFTSTNNSEDQFDLNVSSYNRVLPHTINTNVRMDDTIRNSLVELGYTEEEAFSDRWVNISYTNQRGEFNNYAFVFYTQESDTYGRVDFSSLNDSNELDAVYIDSFGVPFYGEDGYVAKLLEANSTGGIFGVSEDFSGSLSLQDSGEYSFSFIAATEISFDETQNATRVDLSNGAILYTLTGTDDDGVIEFSMGKESTTSFSVDEIFTANYKELDKVGETASEIINSKNELPTEVIEPVEESVEVIEPVEEPVEVIEPVEEPVEVIEPVEESVEVIEPTEVIEPVEESVEVIEPAEEPTEVIEPEVPEVLPEESVETIEPVEDTVVEESVVTIEPLEKVDATLQEIPEVPTDLPVTDPLTGMATGIEGKDYFGARYWRDDSGINKLGFRGIDDDNDYWFVAKNSSLNDDITGESMYAVAVWAKNSSFDEARVAGELVMSDSFSVGEGERTFTSIDGELMGNLKSNFDDGQRYRAGLIDIEMNENIMEIGMGMASREMTDIFEAKLDKFMLPYADISDVSLV